jgi:hypothetical protein
MQTIREYRQLESLEKGVEKAEQQLSALNTFTTQKQQLAGFSEKDITELIALLGRWSKQWPGIVSPSLDQGNGSSSTSGSKLDDRLIRHCLIN